MTMPTQTCQLCGRAVIVTPDGRGFPPDIAERRLRKLCKPNGCPSSPKYRAGLKIGPPPHGMEK